MINVVKAKDFPVLQIAYLDAGLVPPSSLNDFISNSSVYSSLAYVSPGVARKMRRRFRKLLRKARDAQRIRLKAYCKKHRHNARHLMRLLNSLDISIGFGQSRRAIANSQLRARRRLVMDYMVEQQKNKELDPC